MNKPVYLGLSIFELYKIVMHKFWYDYVKPKYEEEAKLCFMDTDCFIVYIKSEVIYIKIGKGVETRFDTLFDLNYGLERPLPQGKNKEVIRLLKGELGRKIITQFAVLRPKAYSYLTDDNDLNKRAKGTKNVSVIKQKLKFEDYKIFLEGNQLEKLNNKLNLI